MKWHKLHVSSAMFFFLRDCKVVTPLPLCFQASKHCCNGWRPRPGSHESCRPPTPGLVEAGTRKQVGNGLLIFADYIRLAIGHYWDLKHFEFMECPMCYSSVGKSWKIRVKYATLASRGPYYSINLVSALTNHSFAAENVGETPTASVQNHVLGVQNLQIHVLVNGFQGALVLHSWRLVCINWQFFSAATNFPNRIRFTMDAVQLDA